MWHLSSTRYGHLCDLSPQRSWVNAASKNPFRFRIQISKLEVSDSATHPGHKASQAQSWAEPFLFLSPESALPHWSPKWTPSLSIFSLDTEDSFLPSVQKAKVKCTRIWMDVPSWVLTAPRPPGQLTQPLWGSFPTYKPYSNAGWYQSITPKTFSLFQCMWLSHTHAYINKLTQLPYSFFLNAVLNINVSEFPILPLFPLMTIEPRVT